MLLLETSSLKETMFIFRGPYSFSNALYKSSSLILGNGFVGITTSTLNWSLIRVPYFSLTADNPAMNFYHKRENGIPQGADLIWKGCETTTLALREHNYEILCKLSYSYKVVFLALNDKKSVFSL